jgi:hypothetical protein
MGSGFYIFLKPTKQQQANQLPSKQANYKPIYRKQYQALQWPLL